MKTNYTHNAKKAEELLRKMQLDQIMKSNEKIAAEQAYMKGYNTAINDAIEALLHWELDNVRS